MSKKKKEQQFDYASFEAEAIAGLRSGKELVGREGVLNELLQRLVNASLEGELDEHLSEERAKGNPNRRNGHTRKAVRSSLGPVEISPPRDREGSFSPQLVGKWDRELGTGVSEQILSLYAEGQSVRQIQAQLARLYGLEYSSGTISAVTERVWEEVEAWRNRVLESCYVVVFLDAIHYKVRTEGRIGSRAVYTVFGVDVEGKRDVLGLYIGEAEGARQWGLILEDLRRRGVEDVLFFSVDGLAGFKEVIEEVYPLAQVQRCIVHMIRSSSRFVASKDQKAVCRDLRSIYSAANQAEADLALDTFATQWDKRYPQVSLSWRENWEELTASLDYRENIRRMIYTTNAVEALHRIMRKTTKSKGAWVNEKGLFKQLYLTLKYNEKSWKRSVFNWKAIQQELFECFGERYTKWLQDV